MGWTLGRLSNMFYREIVACCLLSWILEILVQSDLHRAIMDTLYTHSSAVFFLAGWLLVYTLSIWLLLWYSLRKDGWSSVHRLYHLSVSNRLFVAALCSSGVLYSRSSNTIIADCTYQENATRLPCDSPHPLHRKCTDTSWCPRYYFFRDDHEKPKHVRILLHVSHSMDGDSCCYSHAEHCSAYHDTTIEKHCQRQVIHQSKSCHARWTRTYLEFDSNKIRSIDRLMLYFE